MSDGQRPSKIFVLTLLRMVEPIYKELVIETEAQMEMSWRWLLFVNKVYRAKSLKDWDLACIQTGHH